MQCKSRKLSILQNKPKCIVLKVEPWLPGFLGSRWTHQITFQTNILGAAKEYQKLAFLQKIPKCLKSSEGQISLWAWAEVDESTARRNLGKKKFGQVGNLNWTKIFWEKRNNFDYLWHEQPNLPPCVADPTQHPPVETDMSRVDKQRNTRDIFPAIKFESTTYFRPGCSCLNWTTVMVKTHFSLFLASSAAW